MQIKSEWRRRDGGDPACLPGIDVSLDVFFREEPVRRDDGGGYHTTREEEAPCSSPTPTRVVSPQHNDGFSQAITRTEVMCIAYTPTRAHRNNNNTTVFRLSVERGRKRELKRERERDRREVTLEATLREQSPELPRSLRRSAGESG